MNLIEIFLREEVDVMKRICELFHVKYIYIDGIRYRVPKNHGTPTT